MTPTKIKKKAIGYNQSSFLLSSSPSSSSSSSSSPHLSRSSPGHQKHNTANDVFPVKLYRLLEETTKNGHDDVISWSPDGMSFKVHDTERFAAEIMPSYFGSNKYRSFQKNLNMWSFKYIERGGKCYHPLFRRGLPHLICQMQRQLVKHQIERLQNKRELKTRKTAEIPKQRRNNEASMDAGLHSLQSSPFTSYDYHNNKSVPIAYSTPTTTSSILEKNKGEQQQQNMPSPSLLLLGEIQKRIDEIDLLHQQQQWYRHHKISQARAGSPPMVEDNVIELHGRRGRVRATGGGDSSGACFASRGDDVIPLINSSLLDSTIMNQEMKRQEGTADSTISFASTTSGVDFPLPPYAFVDGLLLSGLGGLSCLPAASAVPGYVSTTAAESSPLLLSQLQNASVRKFLQEAYNERVCTSARLDINNDIHTSSSTTRRNPSFSRLNRQETERLQNLLLETYLLPNAQPRRHAIFLKGK